MHQSGQIETYNWSSLETSDLQIKGTRAWLNISPYSPIVPPPPAIHWFSPLSCAISSYVRILIICRVDLFRRVTHLLSTPPPIINYYRYSGVFHIGRSPQPSRLPTKTWSIDGLNCSNTPPQSILGDRTCVCGLAAFACTESERAGHRWRRPTETAIERRLRRLGSMADFKEILQLTVRINRTRRFTATGYMATWSV